MLDKPTNHLDAESVQWLEQYLEQYQGTVIAVTHDRYFLENVAGWILELDRGEGTRWRETTRAGSNRSTRVAKLEKTEKQAAEPSRASSTGSVAEGPTGESKARLRDEELGPRKRKQRRAWRSYSRWPPPGGDVMRPGGSARASATSS